MTTVEADRDHCIPGLKVGDRVSLDRIIVDSWIGTRWITRAHHPTRPGLPAVVIEVGRRCITLGVDLNSRPTDHDITR